MESIDFYILIFAILKIILGSHDGNIFLLFQSKLKNYINDVVLVCNRLNLKDLVGHDHITKIKYNYNLGKSRGIKMFKRALKTLLFVVTISAVVIAAFAVSGNNNSPYNIGSDQLTQLTTPSTTNITSNQLTAGQKNKNHNLVNHLTLPIIISPTEAQKIAEKYIEQPGASAGTPKLVKEDGKKVYIVPVIDKANNVGEIHLDAHNGKNLGGAGGAPIN